MKTPIALVRAGSTSKVVLVPLVLYWELIDSETFDLKLSIASKSSGSIRPVSIATCT